MHYIRWWRFSIRLSKDKNWFFFVVFLKYHRNWESLIEKLLPSSNQSFRMCKTMFFIIYCQVQSFFHRCIRVRWIWTIIEHFLEIFHQLLLKITNWFSCQSHTSILYEKTRKKNTRTHTRNIIKIKCMLYLYHRKMTWISMYVYTMCTMYDVRLGFPFLLFFFAFFFLRFH